MHAPKNVYLAARIFFFRCSWFDMACSLVGSISTRYRRKLKDTNFSTPNSWPYRRSQPRQVSVETSFKSPQSSETKPILISFPNSPPIDFFSSSSHLLFSLPRRRFYPKRCFGQHLVAGRRCSFYLRARAFIFITHRVRSAPPLLVAFFIECCEGTLWRSPPINFYARKKSSRVRTHSVRLEPTKLKLQSINNSSSECVLAHRRINKTNPEKWNIPVRVPQVLLLL